MHLIPECVLVLLLLFNICSGFIIDINGKNLKNIQLSVTIILENDHEHRNENRSSTSNDPRARGNIVNCQARVPGLTY